MKNIHIFTNDENEKFSMSYIKFIEENFEQHDHSFLIFGTRKQEIISNSSKLNTKYLSRGLLNLPNLIMAMNKSEKIFLHGLFSPYILLALFMQPWLLKKSYWLLWGGDLYYYQFRRKKLKTNIYEWFRKIIFKNIGGLITHIKGDYELAQKWYGAKGKYYYSFLYPSNLYKDLTIGAAEDPGKGKEVRYIQVGNSACSTNNHVEVFEKIKRFKDIIVLCPLSYSGEEDYINSVIEQGYKLLGKDRFYPMVDFMPFHDYMQLLAKVDIAIFNHKRQRGLGNITTLLGMGKKVYIRNDITTWSFCREHELKVFNANSDFSDLFEPLDKEIKERNIEKVKMSFSYDKLKKDWQNIFQN